MKIEKRFIVFAIAIICGILAILLTNHYIKQKVSRKEAQLRGFLGDAAIVLVASKDIPRGTTIRDNMVGLEKVPSNFAQPNVLTSKGAALGKITAADIAVGEQILSNKITDRKISDQGTRIDLAMRTPAGHRAITISIDALSAVGGRVNPGDYVDLIGDFPVAHQIEGKTITKQMTVTLFQNVLVLAIEGASSARGRAVVGKTTVTLALSPQEAALLSYAQQQGIIRLLLRPPLETEITTLPPVDETIFWSEIMRKSGMVLPEPAPEPEVIEEPPLPSVEIYRGPEKEEIPLER